MKKVLISNAVPTNNGDAALVFALRNKLVEKGYDVFISTMKYETVKKLYPSIKWIKAEYEITKLQHYIFKLMPFFKKKMIKNRVLNNKIYSEVDFIISAPGGYINSYYGIEDRMYIMKLIKDRFNITTAMYSQSVGPLNDKDKNILEEFIGCFDLFMARDEISYKNVEWYRNAIITNDAAFLLDTDISYDEKQNLIAISVREWGFDGRNKEHYINLIRQMTMKCIDNGNNVEFISTCQGLENYVDDSKIAREIIETLDTKYKSKVSVDIKYNSLNELRDKIKKYKFVIGTRLHMCILSVMAGVPAFNISYEIKGKECYKILDLSEYSIDYNGDIRESLNRLQKFIDKNNELREIYIEKAKIMNVEANKYFDIMINKVVKNR